MNYQEINECYQSILGRPVDLSGYKEYINKNKKDVVKILSNSQEAKLKEQRINQKNQTQINSLQYISTFEFEKIPTSYFHIVIARFNEDISWINKFHHLNCCLFVYNKGIEITDKFADNVFIKNVPNVSYEEYIYLTHICMNYGFYKNVYCNIVFLQAGIDHCSHFIDKIANIDNISNFESLFESIGYSSAWGSHTINENPYLPIQSNMFDLGGGEEYINEFKLTLDISQTDLYTYFCNKFNLNILEKPIFSPCAVFITQSNKITKNSLEIYKNMLEYTSWFHYTSYPIMTKILASIFERLWYTIFN